MPITKNECAEIRRETQTYGGDTFHIRRHNKEKWETLCFRPSRGKGNTQVANENGRLLRCAMPAGRNTDHLGFGACSAHGGGGKGQPMVGSAQITHGNTAKIRSTLRNKIDDYKNLSQDELRDLSFELATIKAIFNEMVDVIPDVGDKEFSITLHRLQGMIGTIGTLVDKISRIESRDTLTVAQVIYLRAVVSDILMTYITDPERRDLAAKDLVQRIGGTGEYARVATDGD